MVVEDSQGKPLNLPKLAEGSEHIVLFQEPGAIVPIDIRLWFVGASGRDVQTSK